MSPKSLIVLTLVTALLVLAGLFWYEHDAPPAATEVEGQLVFPTLMDRVNEVASLTVATPKGEFTVARDGETWGLVERGGYPVQVDRIRAALLGLAELETLEKKTADPALYAKLGVQSVSTEDTSEDASRSLTAKAADGTVLAALIIGKGRSTGTGATYYARQPGQAQSWLVEGDRPLLPDEGDAWLDKKILEVARTDVRAARISHAEGETLALAKADADADYTVLDLPEGRELKYASVAGGIAGSMQYLNFEDVKPIAEFERPDVPITVTNLWTKDGARYTVEVFDLPDGKTWALFHAAYDPDGGPQLPAPVGPPAEGEGVAKATPRPEAEVRAELEPLEARLSQWAYELPQYSRTNFTKRLEDLLKPLPEEAPDDAAPTLPGDGGAALDALEGGGADAAPVDEPPAAEAPRPKRRATGAEPQAVRADATHLGDPL
ncbi:MAG: DUF4340 domain-containing protein [Planctomycetes bacterium]|nr:DUF4340 domain-containing protein [Planctomycetota bacterium]